MRKAVTALFIILTLIALTLFSGCVQSNNLASVKTPTVRESPSLSLSIASVNDPSESSGSTTIPVTEITFQPTEPSDASFALSEQMQAQTRIPDFVVEGTASSRNQSDGAPHAYQELDVIPTASNQTVYRTFDFEYRSDKHSVTLPVNMDLYTSAKNSPNKHLGYTSEEQGDFYRYMMTDPGMDVFYGDVLRELRRERYDGGNTLTDDEYLEMLISFVQQIDYDNTTTGNPRYPVEVIYDRTGDCDEKAILLNGLLSREGYDVALLIFPTMKHATSGIRIHLATNRPSFRIFSDGQRDYVYIETTRPRLIGFYTDDYETVPETLVVPVGNGILQYGKIDYVMTIFADLKTIERQLKILDEKAGPSRELSQDDYDAAISYINTYNFVTTTNDRVAAMDAIRRSELRHNAVCLSCG